MLNVASWKPLDDVAPKPKSRKAAAKKVDNGEVRVSKPRKTVAKKNAGIEGEEPVKKPRKPRAKKADTIDGEGGAVKKPVVRKPRAKKADKETPGDSTLKEKPIRKPRAKNAENGVQAKLPKGKVTKVSNAKSGNATSKPKSLEVPSLESADYGLIEAVRRRNSWTPPPPTIRTESTTPSNTDFLTHDPSSATSIVSGGKAKGFTKLIGNYSFLSAENATSNKRGPTKAATRKRKLIELVKTSVATAAAASPEKDKAPRKKPRTITEKATSAYAEAEDVAESLENSAPLLQYFPSHTTAGVAADVFKLPPKPRSKSPSKGGSKAKKGPAKVPVLLSPESALKHVGNQDFVFGTSSQLAREDSPTLLRDLHEAMLASNELDNDDPFADCLLESASLALGSRGKATTSTKRNLWSAASRATGEDLEDVEMIDLACSSPMVTKDTPPAVITDMDGSISDDDEDFWHDVEELSQSISEMSQPVEAPQVPPIDAIKNVAPMPTPPATDTTGTPSPKSIKTTASVRSPKASQPSPKRKTVTKSKDLIMPDFQAYTTVQLAKEIASYRFKPIKSRSSMITLLERCWEGKNRTALANLSTNNKPTTHKSPAKGSQPTSSLKEVSPKRPRGRPRKNSISTSTAKTKAKPPRKKAANTVEYLEMDSDTPLSQMRTLKEPQRKTEDVEDIVDSDTPALPSPPRRTLSQKKKSQPLTLTISSPASDDDTELSPTATQELLFKHISSAVTSAARARDPSHPSWHEKMLLYDPIILEDLAAWLNTGALEKVGWDGEVAPKEVKKWCEMKSVCCLWRESLRNGSRSRY